MSTFSCFQDFTSFAFSSKPTRGAAIYNAMIASEVNAFNVVQGTYEEARIYATAMGLARARYTLDRGGNQLNPLKVVELLPKLEEDWVLVPGAYDGIVTRQLALAARQKLPRGARRENVEEQLRAIYGSDFIAYRTLEPTEVTTWPNYPFSGPGTFKRDDASSLPKYLKLVDPVTILNTSTKVHYTVIQPGDQDVLVKGDVATIQVENLGLAEKVTILTAGEDTSGLFFTAVFHRAHDIGATILTGTVPVWLSTQRYALVIVKATSVLDADKYRMACEVMSHVSRIVSRWSVVSPSTPGATTIGPFTLDTTPIGTATIGVIPIVGTSGGVPTFASPFVRIVIPASGPVAGGTVVEVQGEGFSGAILVMFGANPLGSVVVVDDETITGITAATGAGLVNVSVTTLAGVGTLIGGYTFV